jgi:hypothetical protein
VGGEQVRSGAQRRLLVRLRKQDVELPGQLVEEQAVEEGVLLLAPETEFQGLLGCAGREVEELLNPLNVRQRQATAKLCVRVRRERVGLLQPKNYLTLLSL